MSAAPSAPPQYPAGDYVPETHIPAARRAELIAAYAQAPADLKKLVAPLSSEQLDARYRNWTIRQIVHHLADSHVNTYLRFKVALSEENPTIKPYDETKCAELPDAKSGDIAASLALLEAIHARLVQALQTMTDADFARTFYHPDSQKSYRLDEALNLYVWHSRHHIAQVEWVIRHQGG